MNGINYEVPQCEAFSTPHSHPSLAQIYAISIKWSTSSIVSSNGRGQGSISTHIIYLTAVYLNFFLRFRIEFTPDNTRMCNFDLQFYSYYLLVRLNIININLLTNQLTP